MGHLCVDVVGPGPQGLAGETSRLPHIDICNGVNVRNLRDNPGDVCPSPIAAEGRKSQ